MILVCPNCDARYTLRPNALGAEGKDVRCAKCSHKWYQRSDELLDEAVPQPKPQTDVRKSVEKPVENAKTTPPKEVVSQSDSDFSSPKDVREALREEALTPDAVDDSVVVDIPEGVKPIVGEALSAVKPPASMQAKLTGYLAALVLAGLCIASALFFKAQIISAWPPAYKIFEVAGFSNKIAGEGLVIENVTANIGAGNTGRNLLFVQGRVINLTNEALPVPDLTAQIRSTNGEDGDVWVIKTPMQSLEPGESFIFKSDYANLPRGVGTVKVTFQSAM